MPLPAECIRPIRLLIWSLRGGLRGGTLALQFTLVFLYVFALVKGEASSRAVGGFPAVFSRFRMLSLGANPYQ